MLRAMDAVIYGDDRRYRTDYDAAKFVNPEKDQILMNASSLSSLKAQITRETRRSFSGSTERCRAQRSVQAFTRGTKT
jgi:hypothetical protein